MKDFPDVELVGPRPFKWGASVFLWLLAVFLLGVVWSGAEHVRIGLSGRFLNVGWVSALIVGLAAALQAAQFMGRNVVLTVEGVRRGKGPHATFIRWKDANVRYDRKSGRYVVTADGKRIGFQYMNFADQQRLVEIMNYIRWVIHQRDLKRHLGAEKIETPVHGLSDVEKHTFLKYRGDGFFPNIFWPYLALPTFVLCVVHWDFVQVLASHPTTAYTPQIKAILHAAPLLYHGLTGMVIWFVALITSMAIFMQGLPMLFGLRRRHIIRSGWLAQFDRAQVISMTEFGLTYKEAKRESFYGWDGITGISHVKGLMLFHLVPELPLSIMVPDRIFATPHEAADFYRKARAFKRAALTRPNVIDPISFWEIA